MGDMLFQEDTRTRKSSDAVPRVTALTKTHNKEHRYIVEQKLASAAADFARLRALKKLGWFASKLHPLGMLAEGVLPLRLTK